MDNSRLLIFAIGLLATSFLTQPALAADQRGKGKEISTEKPSGQDVANQTEEQRKRILQEAAGAIAETERALQALDANKADDALAALERASGKLQVILAREPRLALAPTAVRASTHDLLGDAKAVKAQSEQVKDLIDDGHIQEARYLLQNLASETVLRVANIPLATYPAAIANAVKLIDEKKTAEAKESLQSALNTLVVTEIVVPLPVVSAKESLSEAETLAEKQGRSEEENKRLAENLIRARSELERAQAFGYGSKEDFDEMYKQLSEIEDKTEAGKSGHGLFAKIKSSLSDVLSKIRDVSTANQKAK